MNASERETVYRVENPREARYTLHTVADTAMKVASMRAVHQGVTVTVWEHKLPERLFAVDLVAASDGTILADRVGVVIFFAQPPIAPPTSAAAAPGREAEQSQ